MKISLEWLRDYVDFAEGPERLAQILTDVGFPVEEIEAVGEDTMLDVEVTSNRPDCLGHIGVAREVATATGASLRLPEVNCAESDVPVEQLTSVQNDAPELCHRYTARVIQGVTVGSSPDWMRRRLETIGQRSISNVVDITNYVMMEIGQPLHTFDYDKLAGKRIVVRRARPGEPIETIDHSRLKLTADMLVIADAAEPVAVAGVMGGAESEVGDATRTILLESAWFAPLSVRRTSRALSLSSESSYRFERTVSEELVEWASRRAAALLIELAGGKVAKGLIDAHPVKCEPVGQTLRLSRLKRLLGIEIDPNIAINILQRLGFAPEATGADTLSCTVPAWRQDIVQEADLIEEVIRIHGYHQIPTSPAITVTVHPDDVYQRTQKKVVQRLAACGFFETVSVAFIEDKYQQLFAPEGFEPLRAIHQSREVNALRRSLLPSLLNVRKLNQDNGNSNCRLYELAAGHEPAGGDGPPVETGWLAMLCDGELRSLRGALDSVIEGLDRQQRLAWKPAEVDWAAGQTGATLWLGAEQVGQVGLASESVCQAYDLEAAPALAQVRFDALTSLLCQTPPQMQPLPRFPGIARDLSLVLDDTICWADIEQHVYAQQVDGLRDVSFVAIYRGKGIPAGKKSLTFSLTFRHDDRTLTHEEVDTWQTQLVTAMREKFAAELRA